MTEIELRIAIPAVFLTRLPIFSSYQASFFFPIQIFPISTHSPSINMTQAKVLIF